MAIYSGFSHEKWCFSIVMLIYQRVDRDWANVLVYARISMSSVVRLSDFLPSFDASNSHNHHITPMNGGFHHNVGPPR